MTSSQTPTASNRFACLVTDQPEPAFGPAVLPVGELEPRFVTGLIAVEERGVSVLDNRVAIVGMDVRLPQSRPSAASGEYPMLETHVRICWTFSLIQPVFSLFQG